MYRPQVYVPVAVAKFSVVYFAVQALGGHVPISVTWRAAVGALTLALFFLLLRVYDEIKDEKTDLQLARSGDPRYTSRPIITGRVQIGDLRVFRWWIRGALVLINLPIGYPGPLLAFAAALGLTWISFHWFFWSAVPKSPILQLILSNPLSAVLDVYVAAIAIHDAGSMNHPGWLVVLVIGMWMPAAAWEISRKIRHLPDETDYRSYSKILGWRVAPVFPVLFVTISGICMTVIARQVHLSWIYPAALLFMICVVAVASLRFELYPSTRSSNLRPYSELYAMTAYAGLAVALGLRYSVVFKFRALTS
jgi:hypothetical protein